MAKLETDSIEYIIENKWKENPQGLEYTEYRQVVMMFFCHLSAAAKLEHVPELRIMYIGKIHPSKKRIMDRIRIYKARYEANKIMNEHLGAQIPILKKVIERIDLKKFILKIK